MKQVVERCSVVIAGAWNQAIFTLEWVQAVLLDGASPRVELLFNEQGLATQFITDEIKLLVLPSRAQVHLSSLSDAALSQLEVVPVRLLRRLRETPVHAVGINFGFDVDEPSEQIAQLFELEDRERIIKLGGSVDTVTIVRKIAQERRVINLSMAKSTNGPVRIDLNHHYQTSMANVAADVIEGNVMASLNASLELVTGLYGLQRVKA
ncbi:hypothetical protein [Sorangium sp. So ce1335]|uniref:hypothetical protein n=1 Tax=Sorangium sp. So ce1335 TaxID=3133335 RepID=UPI003F5D9412